MDESPRANLNVSRNRSSLYHSAYDTAIEDNDDNSSLYFSLDESDGDSPTTVENKENLSESDHAPVLRFNPVSNASALLRKTLKKQLAESVGTPLRNRNLRVSFYSPVEQTIQDVESNEISLYENPVVGVGTNPQNTDEQTEQNNVVVNENENTRDNVNVSGANNNANNNVANKSTEIKKSNDAGSVQQTSNKNKNKRLTTNSNALIKNVKSTLKSTIDPKLVKNKPTLFIVPTKDIFNAKRQSVIVPTRNTVKTARIQARMSIVNAKKLILPPKKANEPGTSAGPSVAKKPPSKRETINSAPKSGPAEKKEVNPTVINKRKTMAAVRRLTAVRTSLLPTRSTSVQALRRQTKNFLRVSFGSEQSTSRVASSLTTTASTTSNTTTTKSIPAIVVTSVSPENKSDGESSVQSTAIESVGATNTATAGTLQGNVVQKDVKKETNTSNDNEKIMKNAFKCKICQKMCQTELSLKIHMNFHPSTGAKRSATDAKFALPSNNSMSAGIPLKCKYCDKQFRVQIALNKHVEFNCEKIPALERKRIISRLEVKNTTTGPMSASENKHKNRVSVLSDAGQNVSSNEHSGILRTPAKMIRCKLCNEMFISCVEYAEHCSMNH